MTMSKPEPDEMTEHDWCGVQRLIFAVEDRLGKADDVNVTLENIISLGVTLVGVKDREEFERHFRTLCQPLVMLELERRADAGRLRCSISSTIRRCH